MTNRLSVYSADMPRNGPIEGSLRRLPGMEALELLVMDSEYHKLPILRAECCLGPNAAIATVKVDYSKISECWRCYAEAQRYLSQPWSNCPLNLSIHSLGT